MSALNRLQSTYHIHADFRVGMFAVPCQVIEVSQFLQTVMVQWSLPAAPSPHREHRQYTDLTDHQHGEQTREPLEAHGAPAHHIRGHHGDRGYLVIWIGCPGYRRCGRSDHVRLVAEQHLVLLWWSSDTLAVATRTTLSCGDWPLITSIKTPPCRLSALTYLMLW